MSLSIKTLSAATFMGGRFFNIAKKVISPFGRGIFKFLVLPFYGKYLWLKKKFSNKASNRLEKFILVFTNRYTIHLLILIIALGVTASNLLAYESRQDYGREALIYKIIGAETIEIIEDTALPVDETQSTSYLGKSSQVTSEIYTESQKREEEIALYESELVATIGGNTLIKPDLVSTQAAKSTRNSVKEYIVEDGDTISSIAYEFNISINTILWANNLSLRSYIRPGQKLTIPPTTGVLHTIAKGDNLTKIAKKYGVSEASIKEYNRLDNDKLVVNETIMIPGGQKIQAVVPRASTYTYSPKQDDVPIVASTGKMQWPSSCKRISQYYRGWRHTGLDIACPFGTPIRAAAAGMVTRVQFGRTGYGYNVIISHGGGKETLYAHFSRISVKSGEKVSKGEIIGYEGSTGRSTGPHLHFEVRIGGSQVNPLGYIR